MRREKSYQITRVYKIRIQRTQKATAKAWYAKHEGAEFSAILYIKQGFNGLLKPCFLIVADEPEGRNIPAQFHTVTPEDCRVIDEELFVFGSSVLQNIYKQPK